MTDYKRIFTSRSRLKYYLYVNLVPAIFILGWVATNIYLFVDTLLSYKHERYHYTKKILGDSLAVARASAKCLNFNCFLILIPVCRHFLELLRTIITRLKWTAFCSIIDEAIYFHMNIAYTILIWTLVHYYSHCYNVERFTEGYRIESYSEFLEDLSEFKNINETFSINEYKDELLSYSLTKYYGRYNLQDLDENKGVSTKDLNYINPLRPMGLSVFNAYYILAGWNGIIITGALVLIFASSIEHIRRHYFEVFWFTHHLFVIFFVFLFFHGSEGSVRQLSEETLKAMNNEPEKCDFILINAFIRNLDKVIWDESIGCPEPKFVWGGMSAWKWITASCSLYIIDGWVIRFLNFATPVQVVRVTKHLSNVVQIDMRKESLFSIFRRRIPLIKNYFPEKSYIKGEVGQYIQINCSDISRSEWHPFTLTSSPESDLLSVFIRKSGDWTTSLHLHLAKMGKEGKLTGTEPKFPRLCLNGPFGASSQDIYTCQSAICIGMGIGVTPFASLLKSLSHNIQKFDQMNDNHNPTGAGFGKVTDNLDVLSTFRLKNLSFIWSARTTAEFEWFIAIMKNFETAVYERNKNLPSKLKFHLDIQLYITADFSTTDISHILVNEDGEFDPITKLRAKTRYKRPHWRSVFSKIVEKKYEDIDDYLVKDDIGIFYCGTPVALPAIKEGYQYTERMIDERFERNDFDEKGRKRAVNFFFHKENF